MSLNRTPQAELLRRITVDPTLCHGQPCIRQLRYPVTTMLELLSSGMTFQDILEDYEDLEADDLKAVLAFAAEAVKRKSISFLWEG